MDFKTKRQVRNIFKKLLNIMKDFCTCGSGISACSLAFALFITGNFTGVCMMVLGRMVLKN